MKIYMSKDQARRVADFLRQKKSERERKLERDYDWSEMAADIHLTPETLRKLKDARGGMHLDTAIALRKAFGPEIMRILGFPADSQPGEWD